ncbi:MAG TPA: hypothetical protein ENG12_03150 [Candidatus Altiarchaeales archaeon]|nr:hypothetical protein [Candidatus Altiarchaeales archaeon]
MAKRKKRLRVKEGKDSSRFMIYLMIAAMLFSGFYMLRWWGPEEESRSLPSMETYDVRQMGNASILISVRDIETEIVAEINTPISFETIRDIQNTSLDGLKRITLEVGNPVFYESAIEGRTYLLFRFTFDELDDNRTNSVRNILNSKLGTNNYELLRGCMGSLPINISGPGTDRVYFPCGFDTEKDDYFRIFLLKKTKDGLFEGTIGFVEKKIEVGPVIDADVVNITNILAQGVIESDFYPDRLYRINTSDMEILPPRVLINKTVKDEVLEKIDSLPGVDVRAEDNKTIISFNSSHENISRILEIENISYNLETGYLALTLPENASLSFINYTLNEARISNITFEKTGSVSLPEEVIIDGKLVTIPNNDRFNALLKIDTEIGDRVNISLSTLRYGDQIFIMGAGEI